MTARTSKTLPLLCVLLVIAIAIAGWSALRDTLGPDPDVLTHDAVEAPYATKIAEQAPLAALPDPPEQPALLQPAPVASNAERASVATNAELELADAIWISGRMVYPEGTPLGEQVDVIAKGRDFKSSEMHRARVDPGGDFRVAFGPKTRSGSLEIDAPHLFLTQSITVKLKEGKPVREVLVEPLLGACLQGQLRLPAQAQDVAAQLVGQTVSSAGWARNGNENCQRSASVDSNLRFELRGLDPKLEHSVYFHSGVVAAASFEKLELQAGETRQIDLNLSLGVRLRGRVTFAGAQKPEAMHLSIRSTLPRTTERTTGAVDDPGFGGEDSVEDYVAIDDSGSFDARGMTAGRIQLRASATQRTQAVLDLGLLGDGEVREGLELALGLGGRIGGRLLWPDGTAAVGASIELTTSDESTPRERFYINGTHSNDIGRVLTDAQGEFLISGLEQGPFNLLAQAKPRELAPKAKRRAPTWKVEIEAVAIGTRDLELVLLGGFTVSGVALDDAGAPIENFRISATPVRAGTLDESKQVSAKFSSKEGRFELGGLPEGTHSLALSALRHESPEPLRIEVPGEVGPFTFVATRQASISGFVVLPDGSPAARASLNIQSKDRPDPTNYGGKSNAQGEFTLTRVNAGWNQVRAKLKGYASSTAWPLQVAPGQAIEGLRLVLRRGARISGEVHPSREGETIFGREVHGYNSERSEYLSGSTDDKGRFLFEGVDPGEYTITLQPSPEEKLALVAPGGNSEEQGWELDNALLKTATANVDEGGEAHVVFGTDEHATVRIAGTVRRGESPQEFVRVRAMLAEAADARDAKYSMTDSSGRFELAVGRAGKYRVEAMPESKYDLGAGPLVHMRVRQSLPVGSTFEVPAGGLDGVDIAIPSGRIAGRVHVAGSAATGWIQVVLERNERDRAWGSSDHETWPDADFAFDNLSAGTYTIVAGAWVPDSTGRPQKELGPVRHTIELGVDQTLGDVRIEIENR